MVHTINPKTLEAEIDRSLSVQGQPSLQELVPGQLGLLDRETLSQKKQRKKNERKNL